MPAFEPSRLNSAELKALDSVGYRNQAPGFDARRGEGARRFGGRFNPAHSYPVIYLCLTKRCVVAELTAQAPRQSIQGADLLPRELWSVATSLERVLDLTDASVLAALALESIELVRPERTGTQQIGEAVHERGVQAIKSSSATGVDDVLAVFPENLGVAVMSLELLQVWSTTDAFLAPPGADPVGGLWCSPRRPPGAGTVAVMAGQAADEPWEDVVSRLDDDVVRRLLIGAAMRNPDVGRAVRLAAADSSERIAVLKAEVDRRLRTRRYLGYRESSGWALEASPVVDALADAVASEPSRELVVLLERAVGHVIKVILRADDSDGMIGDLARRILDLHEQACDAGGADPAGLAKWMIRFSLDDQDFFVTDPVRYAPALGEQGLAIFRREVSKRAAVSPSFATKYALERLAVLDRDPERIVELLGGDLSSPHQFIQVAEAVREIGRVDDALAWARRGIDTTAGWQVAKLFDLSAEMLDERDATGEVLALRREHHERMPTSSTYARLKTTAIALECWEDEVAAARAVLAVRDRGTLIDALLSDGDSDAAWEVATADPDWDAGEQRWQRLAEAREEVDPAAAFGVYLRLADTALLTAGRGQYQLAARRLKAARRTTAAAGLEAEFEAHVLALREQHRRRPTFIEILDKARLP